MVPVLYYGFGPKCSRAIALYADQLSADVDQSRLGPNLSIDDVREAHQFLELLPLHQDSKKRTLILNMERASANSQHALLRLLESPSDTAMAILSATSLADILPTILSRCILVNKMPGTFGERVQALMQDGLTPARAAEVATALDLGLPQRLVPHTSDESTADLFMDVLRRRDVNLALSAINSEITDGVMVALRQRLLNASLYSLLAYTYSVNEWKAAFLKLVYEGVYGNIR